MANQQSNLNITIVDYGTHVVIKYEFINLNKTIHFQLSREEVRDLSLKLREVLETTAVTRHLEQV